MKKNTSSRPIGHNKYNYGEKNHKNDLAQLFDSGSASRFSLPLSSFLSPLALLSFLKRDDWGRVRHSIAMLEQCYNHLN